MVKVVERQINIRQKNIPKEILAVKGLLKRKKNKILREYFKFRQDFNKL
mgnify:CR=1 FL=1